MKQYHFCLNWQNIGRLRDWLDAIAQDDKMFFDVYVSPPDPEDETPAILHLDLNAYWRNENGKFNGTMIAAMEYEFTPIDDATGVALPPELREEFERNRKEDDK